jgi:hypothetical protein
MFGFLNPNPSDLIQLWPNEPDMDKDITIIVHQSKEAQKETKDVQAKRFKQNLTYRNQNLHKKNFKAGNVVLQRQLLLARGLAKLCDHLIKDPMLFYQLYF